MKLEELREFLTDELTPAKGQRGKYICPLCGSGTGAHKTAALSVKGQKWTCFSCGESGDIFDLVAKREGITLSEAAQIVIRKYAQPGRTPRHQAPARNEKRNDRNIPREVEAFHAQIHGSEGEKYLGSRRITGESISRFRLGYDPRRRSVIIPYDRSGSYYGMRNIDPAADHAHDKPAGLKAPLFNGAALQGEKPCFVVESPLCAISIMQECPEAAAVALGGCNFRLLQGESIKSPLLLCMDNDKPGQEAQAKLEAWLKQEEIPYTVGNAAGEHKDPNEALQADQEAFAARVAALVASFADEAQRAEEAEREAYMQRNAAHYIGGFLDEVSNSAANPPIPTGFAGLDKLLDGGLYPGVYTLGAISSLGKTSFVLQMCDQMTAAGHDVLYYALEMAREELVAKSVSRITMQHVEERNLPAGIAKTTRGILSGTRYTKYSPMEMETIAAAIDQYGAVHAPRMWINESIGRTGVEEIRQQAEQHIRFTGHRPVVVVDYLQLLSPPDVRASDKQNTDRNVLDLKQMSRDLRLPVVAISSLNRDNYTEPINTAAFKESGAIEYGSDCLIGLQYAGMEYAAGDGKETRVKRIRELFAENDEKARSGGAVDIEIKVLKNRNGARGFSDPLAYKPMFNLFREYPKGWTRVDEPKQRRI